MKISYFTVKDNLDTSRGYGQAGINVVTSLQALGHEVTFNDPTAPVQISFCQPAWMEFHPGQYKIGYTPWESTELPRGWRDYFNACDEVWATSEWVAKVYKDQGVTKPIYVYEHGLDPKWQPVKRTYEGKLNFLHVGEPALRKGGQMAIDAFREVFADRDDVHLTVKAYFQHYLRAWRDGEHVLAESAGFDNVTITNELLNSDELRQMYADSHVLVYPSYGEGFGFIPLQALGTGMPTICTDEWAPYKKFITMPLNGRWDRSIWTVHPGNVLYPDYEQLKTLYRRISHDPQYYLDWAYDKAPQVHEEYNWLTKTEKAWDHIVKKFG